MVTGRDEGPDPHEFVEAALAACTILTVQMYAKPREGQRKALTALPFSDTLSTCRKALAYCH